MEIIRESAFGASLLPKDAKALNYLATKAFEKSREGEGCLNQRMIAPLAAITSIALSILSIPVYAIKTLLEFSIMAVNLNANGEFDQVTKDLTAALTLPVYSMYATLLVAASIIAPQTAFSYLEPEETKAVEPEHVTIITNLKKKLKTALTEKAEKDVTIKTKDETINRFEREARDHTCAPSADILTEIQEKTKLLQEQKEEYERLLLEQKTDYETKLAEASTITEGTREELIVTIRAQFEEQKAQIEQEHAKVKREIEQARDRLQALADRQAEEIQEKVKVIERLQSALSSPSDPSVAPSVDVALITRAEQAESEVQRLKAQIATLSADGQRVAEQHREELAAREQELAKFKEQELKISEKAELEQLRREIATNREELQGLRDQHSAIEKAITDMDKRDRARYEKPGTEILSFMLGLVKYEVVCCKENENSIVQADRVRVLVRRFKEKENGDILASRLLNHVVTDRFGESRAIIDLTGRDEVNLIPDLSKAGETAADIQLDGFTMGSWYADARAAFDTESYDPTKSPKYGSYMDEMKAYCAPVFDRHGWRPVAEDSSELAKGMLALEVYIKQETAQEALPNKGDRYLNPRKRYQYFSAKLNQVCTLLQTQTEMAAEERHPKYNLYRQMVNEIVIARWMKVSLDGYLDGLVDHVTKASEVPMPEGPPTIENFAHHLIHINSTVIKQAPTSVKKSSASLNAQKASGELGGEDFTGMKNTPGIRSVDTYTDGDHETTVSYVRHGCPTKGGIIAGAAGYLGRLTGIGEGDSGERVVSNFEQFLYALDEQETPGAAFITTHQQYDGGNENTRVDQVLKLQEKHPNCAVLVQPIGQGHLAKKEGKYAEDTTFAELKAGIIENFFANKSEYKDYKRSQLPAFITERDAYLEETRKLIDFVFETFFTVGDDFSSVEVRQEFLLIFYFYQRMDLMFRFQETTGKPIKYMTTFCKDFLDRGGIVALTHSSIMAMITGQFHKKQWMDGQIRHVCGPPLLVKRQEMIPKKLAIYGPLHARLARIYTEEGEALGKVRAHKFAGKWSLTKHELALRPNQKAFPDIGELKTREEMQERILWLSRSGRARPIALDFQELLTGLAEDTHAIPDDAEITLNGAKITLEALLERAGDIREDIQKILGFSQNGFMEAGRKQMAETLVREDKGLTVTAPANLKFIITENDGVWNIQIKFDHDFIATDDLSARDDDRFRGEDVVAETKFAKIRTTLGISYAVGSKITQNGTFAWEVAGLN